MGVTIRLRDRCQTEDQLQRAVVQYLNLVKPRGLWFAIANNPRSARDGARLKAMGLKAGVADLVFIRESDAALERAFDVLFIELKTAKGRQSAAQKTFAAECSWVGAPYVVCRSIHDVAHALNVGGFL